MTGPHHLLPHLATGTLTPRLKKDINQPLPGLAERPRETSVKRCGTQWYAGATEKTAPGKSTIYNYRFGVQPGPVPVPQADRAGAGSCVSPRGRALWTSTLSGFPGGAQPPTDAHAGVFVMHRGGENGHPGKTHTGSQSILMCCPSQAPPPCLFSGGLAPVLRPEVLG